ncbi:S1 RNA-binding domain-containing protein [Streptomyces sp. ISID311]|uniref:S1 RNA-binding domain-containing protein n=1 Tax=Streptomyces sp. ISID311 TaxID=2601673 RepID=UPI0011BD3AFC|nr:S1 RNA-binding domain-containing protein [Streptomyces sp. ISID311]TXC95026.1 S1 RNA-binding domain-containing protein [Streptomyces sp. ISID311]
MKKFEHNSPRALLETLQPGQVCKGVVSSVADFGVFVDLGGAVGIVDVPNLSWRRFDHPSQVAHKGQEVVATVLSVDLEREQASLSIKELQQDPFIDFARSRFGSTTSGPVIKIAPIGAFIQLEDEWVGLLPISELGGSGRTVGVGDTLNVKITYINMANRQVALSLSSASTNSD